MDTVKLRAFCTVARLQSISKAAEKLSYTQPAISTQIRALENEYGVELFNRNGNRIDLTEAGHQLLPMAQKLLGLFEESRETVKKVTEEEKHFIRIGASAMPGVYILPELVAKFAQDFPQYSVSISIASAFQLERMMMDNEVDVGIIGRSGPTPNEKHFIEAELFDDPLVFVISNNHPLVESHAIEPRQLTGEKLILPPSRILTRVAVEERLLELGVGYQLHLEISSSEAIKRLIMNDLGVSIMCESVVKTEVRSGLLRAIHVNGLNLWRKIYVSYPANKGITFAAHEFVDSVFRAYHS